MHPEPHRSRRGGECSSMERMWADPSFRINRWFSVPVGCSNWHNPRHRGSNRRYMEPSNGIAESCGFCSVESGPCARCWVQQPHSAPVEYKLREDDSNAKPNKGAQITSCGNCMGQLLSKAGQLEQGQSAVVGLHFNR